MTEQTGHPERVADPIAKMKDCPKCGASNPPDVRYCDNCGASMVGATASEPQKKGGFLGKVLGKR
ncbi:MAG: zinc-ribbon domain-containing protein [Anaerolineae bacterium]